MEKEKVIVEAVKEVGKEVYKEVAQSSARNVGDFLGTLTGFFNHVVVYPLKKLNIKYEQKIIAFERKMKEKYKNIPLENRIEPELHIVGPTLESLKYNILDDDLSDLFSNLLISDLDNRTQKNCSPSFIKIIEQLSPIDANIYKKLYEILNLNYRLPICELFLKNANLENMQLAENPLPKNIVKIDLFNINPYVFSKSLENLSRLGLITISYDSWLTDDSKYKELISQEYIQKIGENYRNIDKYGYKIEMKKKGKITLSEFSISFANTCLRSK